MKRLRDKHCISGRLWPAHLKPKDDELLTSWLVRLSIAHGLNLSRFFSIVFSDVKALKDDVWIRDLDKFAATEMLEVLAKKTCTSIARVRATGLAAYEGVLFDRCNPNGHLTWIMPVGVDYAIERMPGLQFCPLCLAEDKEPYFRRSWRLSFVVLCTKHRVPMLSRCVECGAAVAFHKPLTGIELDLPSHSITLCHSCKADLRNSSSFTIWLKPSIQDDEIEFQGHLIEVMNKGWTEIPGSGVVYSHLYFEVLRRLMRLLSGGRIAWGLRESISKRYGVENFAVEHRSDKNQYIEYLDVSVRRGLLNMTRQLFRDWPNEFIDFCQANKLWSQRLFKDMSSVPFWFWSVVHDYRTRTRYEYTDEEIESALQCMERMKQQLGNYRPCRYSERMKAVAQFLFKARCSKYYKSNKWPNMQKKSNWRSKGWTGRYEDSHSEPEPIRLIPDTLWMEVEKILPPSSTYSSGKKRGGNAVNERRLLNGMLYILCTGTPWLKMPAEFGPYSTIYYRYSYWKRTGIFNEIWMLCSHIYDPVLEVKSA